MHTHAHRSSLQAAPFFATNWAVLSTIALMSGGGWITPTACVWLSTDTFSPLRSGAGSASLTSPTATTADDRPLAAVPFAAITMLRGRNCAADLAAQDCSTWARVQLLMELNCSLSHAGAASNGQTHAARCHSRCTNSAHAAGVLNEVCRGVAGGVEGLLPFCCFHRPCIGACKCVGECMHAGYPRNVLTTAFD
jgi:hypothetical protein